MRLTRVRITLRWMMVLIALVAITIWGELMRRRSSDFRTRAARFASEERIWDAIKRDGENVVAGLQTEIVALEVKVYASEVEPRTRLNLERTLSSRYRMAVDALENVNRWQDHAKAASDLKHKYQLAAYFPWLSVSPDPKKPFHD